jgi:kumamolisin
MKDRVALPGSEREPIEARVIGRPDKPEITVSVVLEDTTKERLLYDFASEHFLRIEDDGKTRVVKLTGAPSNFEDAFGVTLDLVEHPDLGVFRRREGAVTIPENLQGTVHAVLGLDDRPAARMHLRLLPRAEAVRAWEPNDLAAYYGFPSGVNGSGQTVGIIELGGGFNQKDLDNYLTIIGISTPVNPVVVGVDGGRSQSDGPNGADGEVMLDAEVVAAVAPGAHQRIYFAPNTDAGFVDAIAQAAAEGCSVISISWGAPEDAWTAAARSAFRKVVQDVTAHGVTVTAAAGDNGSGDGAGDGKSHVDFPAALPEVLACGGTEVTSAGEVVWNEDPTDNATGGGVSRYYVVPSYQASIALAPGAGLPVQADTQKPGRVVPDVAGNADPNSGYNVRVDGQDYVIGGTSAVAPLWAGLIALVNEQLGSGVNRVGAPHAKLYAAGQLKDITEGNNGAYHATVGFDACTGLGSPDGSKVLAALGAGTTAPPINPPGGGTPVDPPASPDDDDSALEEAVERFLKGIEKEIRAFLRYLKRH